MADQVRIPGEAGKSDKPKIIFIAIVIIILAILNGLLYFEYKSSKENLRETIEIKNELDKELKDAYSKLKDYEGKIGNLDNMVSSLKNELDKKGKLIEGLLSSKKISESQLQKARKELESLIKEKDIYISKIDSLYKVNKELIAQNIVLQGDLDEEQIKTNRLSNENINLANKVSIASVLKAINITSLGLRVRNNKDKESTKAKRTEKIRICFTLLENKVTQKGIKEIFVRILGPDGAILTRKADEVDTFNIKGETSIYTIKNQVDYNNEQQDVCLYWDKGSVYQSGKYITEIYEQGYIIGKSEFNLK